MNVFSKTLDSEFLTAIVDTSCAAQSNCAAQLVHLSLVVHTSPCVICCNRSPTGRSLDLGGPIYIGGVRSTFNYETITTRHFDGCIRNVKINQDVLDLSAAVSQSKGVVLGTCPALADFCHKTTCLNGVCQNVWNGSYCACTKSHGGRFCETSKCCTNTRLASDCLLI